MHNNNMYRFFLFREVFTKLAMDQDSGTSHTLQEKQETKPKTFDLLTYPLLESSRSYV